MRFPTKRTEAQKAGCCAGGQATAHRYRMDAGRSLALGREEDVQASDVPVSYYIRVPA